MDREMDAKIAIFCGWRPSEPFQGQRSNSLWDDEWLYDLFQKGQYTAPDGTTSLIKGLPAYSSDLNAMAEAERVVAERGLDDKYIVCLLEIIAGWNGLFVLATATAAQRAAALCRVIDGQEE